MHKWLLRKYDNKHKAELRRTAPGANFHMSLLKYGQKSKFLKIFLDIGLNSIFRKNRFLSHRVWPVACPQTDRQESKNRRSPFSSSSLEPMIKEQSKKKLNCFRILLNINSSLVLLLSNNVKKICLFPVSDISPEHKRCCCQSKSHFISVSEYGKIQTENPRLNISNSF